MTGKEGEVKNVFGEIPGIEWPTGDLDFNASNFIVETSKSKPLRILIAEQIIKEGNQLVEIIKIIHPTPSPEKDNQNIAVKEGFIGAGRLVLKSEAYLLDQEGFVNSQLRAVDLFKKLTKTEPFADDMEEESRMRSDMRKTLRIIKKEAVQSLNIDPRGFHLLKKGLNERILICTKAFEIKDDPEVIGFRKGIERYQQLYLQTVSAWATPDTNSLMQKVKARLTIIPK